MVDIQPKPRRIDGAALEGMAALEGVGLAARQDLAASAQQRTLAPGDVLITQGTQQESMYLVLEGSLGVHLDSVDGEPVAVIGRGETVGELGVLDGSPASAHVVAREAGLVLEVRESDFWRLTDASHAFALNLLLKLAARLRSNNAAVSSNVLKRRQYERAAMFDGLTGIHNRRWLDDTLHRMVRRHADSGELLAVALIDVDHFKSFNDRFGHAAGDHVLTAVAQCLQENLRPTDLVARFGGEEFVTIFPATALENAVRVADRVRIALSGRALVAPDGTALPNVTCSIGIAQLHVGESVADLLKRADLAMYQAKQSGRNRVLPAS